MARSKMGGNQARDFKVHGDHLQFLESNSTIYQSVADLQGNQIGRVRLFLDDRQRKELVKEVTLPKRGMGPLAKEAGGGRDLQMIQDQIEDPEIALDLILNLDNGTVSLAVETEPTLVGQDLSTPVKDKDIGRSPVFDDEPFDDGYWSAEEAATHLGVAKSTITRRIKANQLIGFKLFKNALYVPREQIDGKSTVRGLADILKMFDNEHYETWGFLSSSIFYGDPHERPIDKLKAVKTDADLRACLKELEVAKAGFQYGDHM